MGFLIAVCWTDRYAFRGTVRRAFSGTYRSAIKRTNGGTDLLAHRCSVERAYRRTYRGVSLRVDPVSVSFHRKLIFIIIMRRRGRSFTRIRPLAAAAITQVSI